MPKQSLALNPETTVTLTELGLETELLQCFQTPIILRMPPSTGLQVQGQRLS